MNQKDTFNSFLEEMTTKQYDSFANSLYSADYDPYGVGDVDEKALEEYNQQLAPSPLGLEEKCPV